MRIAFAVTAVAILLASPSAHAAGCGPDASQLALDMCARDDFQRAAVSLDALYDRMMREPALSDRLDRLRAAEQAWVVYRDAECRFEDSWAEGGSMQPMLNSECARALTERRITALTAALSCVHDSGPANCRSPQVQRTHLMRLAFALGAQVVAAGPAMAENIMLRLYGWRATQWRRGIKVHGSRKTCPPRRKKRRS